MTGSTSELGNGSGISTHILTRRMTEHTMQDILSVVFQLTSSQGG